MFEVSAVLAEHYAGLADAITFPPPEGPTDDALAARAFAPLRGRS